MTIKKQSIYLWVSSEQKKIDISNLVFIMDYEHNSMRPMMFNTKKEALSFKSQIQELNKVDEKTKNTIKLIQLSIDQCITEIRK